MSNDGSLHKDVGVFNLETEQGVTQLLLSIRTSDLSAPQKNELRDLVFLYTNGGRDESVKITLEQKIATFKVAPIVLPVTTSTVVTPPVVHPFGTSRPFPAFTPGVKSTVSAPEQTPVTPIPAQPDIVIKSAPEPVRPVVDVPTPVHTPVAKPIPTPTVSNPTVPQQPAVTPTEAPVVVTPTQFDPEQNLSRIREIKSIVNGQVGNPVNLIDINNEVGREYMAALLDAMKKLSSGSPAPSAMSRLEVAFKAVQKAIEEHTTEKNADNEATSVPTPLEAQPVVPVEAVIPSATSHSPADLPTEPLTQAPVEVQTPPVVTSMPVAPEIIEQKSQRIPITPQAPEVEAVQEPETLATPIQIKITPATSESRFKPVAVQENSVSETDVVDAPTYTAPASSPIPQPTVSIPINKTPSIQTQEHTADFEPAWGPATDTLKQSADTTVQKFTSLAQVKEKLRTPSDLADPASVDTSSVVGDLLYTREVDDGLDQLLSEWPIFKKSGLFGTGPKGRAHPLFLKVANLQIPLLLAGRFEGATQETKQSITDYMNGWRYEQGIIYEQGENFEHYLRRVIRHILDLQNRKPLA